MCQVIDGRGRLLHDSHYPRCTTAVQGSSRFFFLRRVGLGKFKGQVPLYFASTMLHLSPSQRCLIPGSVQTQSINKLGLLVLVLRFKSYGIGKHSSVENITQTTS